MKYSCQNFKTLENGITGALNFDLLVIEFNIFFQFKNCFYSHFGLFHFQDFTLENGINRNVNKNNLWIEKIYYIYFEKPYNNKLIYSEKIFSDLINNRQNQ